MGLVSSDTAIAILAGGSIVSRLFPPRGESIAFSNASSTFSITGIVDGLRRETTAFSEMESSLSACPYFNLTFM